MTPKPNEILVFRHSNGLLYYMRPNGTTSLLIFLQNNIFKVDEAFTNLIYNLPGYKIIPIQTTDGIPTFELIKNIGYFKGGSKGTTGATGTTGAMGATGATGPIGPPGIAPTTYQVYTALISQTGANAPTIVSDGTGPNTPLQNTIGNIIWTRVGTGIYNGTLAAAFPSQLKTYSNIEITGPPQADAVIAWVNANTVQINTFNPESTGTFADSVLTFAKLEIRVYP